MTEQQQKWKAPGALRRARHERGAFLPRFFFSDARHTMLWLIALVAMAPSLAETPAPSTPAAQSSATVPASETPKGADRKTCENPRESEAPNVTEAYRPQAVRKANNLSSAGPTEFSHETNATLRDTIALKVEHLDKLLQAQECRAAGGVKKKIVLYLNDRAIPDVAAEPPLDPVNGIVMFPLKRTEASRDVWANLLGKPTSSSRTVRVSLGLEDQFAVKSSAQLELTVLPAAGFRIWLVLFLALLVGFLLLTWHSDILRDGDAPLLGDARKPWSLSRCQAAWWFFLVLASYLLIGLVTGDYSTSITGTTLVLLGIAAGTTISSVAVDISKATPANAAEEKAARERLTKEIDELDDEISAFDVATADPNAAADNQLHVAERNAKQSQLRKLNRECEGFLKDILSDANGVSLHRFQIAAWTLVLGFVFVSQVFRDLSMPQFDSTLLGLMGLSSATFVAMKTTEPVAPKPDDKKKP